MKILRSCLRPCLWLRLGACLFILTLLSAGIVRAQAPVPDSPAIEAKAQAMLAKLTLAQKIELIGGVDSFYTYAVPEIQLPRLKMSDGPEGVRTWGPTTAYPAGAALAATWDTELARKIGEGLGRDARARGVNILLAPGVNISRTPLAARNFEYFSEDPFLNARLVVPYIEGVQSQGVAATVKHFAANNQEYNRHNVSSEVDERTLREIYLPAFEAAVKVAHVDAVMNSYNLLNGVHATQNDFLNVQLLKGEWGFKGLLMSDWDATYDSVAAANNGLDLEMPYARLMNATNLMPAIKAGTVKESTIDDKILRLLRLVLRYGFLDHDQLDLKASTYSVADRAVALKGARESLTLLKNENHFLPLDPGKIKTIAVIGPDAYPAVPGGGGSSEPTAFAPVSILTGVADLLGPNVHVLYTRGLATEMEIFKQTVWQGKIKQETYASKDFSGAATVSELDKVADWKPSQWDLADKAPRSLRYTATYQAAKTGKYILLAEADGGDLYTVKVNGKQLIEQHQTEGQAPLSTILELTANQPTTIVVDYLPSSPGVRLALGLLAEENLLSPETKKFAAAADAVVLAIGFGPRTESEGSDRSFALPWGQDALAEAVLAANPHTVVTYTGGVGADLRRWLDKAPALLATYYPGQEGGTAIAEVVFGKRNPEGKLPVTFDRSWEESASAAYYYPVVGADTALHVTDTDGRKIDYVIPHVKYDDHLLVGYRYWTTKGKQPLFPFGFGLSYSTFKFENLTVPASIPLGALQGGATIEATFDVTNSSTVAGADVAQLYVSDPSAHVARPERELKGFAKVRLAAGETKHVKLSLDARAFSYWDETAHKWTIDPGKFILRVGDSSVNTPLNSDLTLQ